VAPSGKVTNGPLAQQVGQATGQGALGHAARPSISTPPIFGSMAVRHRASFSSSAPTTAARGIAQVRSCSAVFLAFEQLLLEASR
jgi:hypothetical protein